MLVDLRRSVLTMSAAYLLRSSFTPSNKCDLEKTSALCQSEILPWRDDYRVFEAGREILPAEFS
jgi:hypothetical protein